MGKPPTQQHYEVATHEMGHAIAWNTAGIPIKSIRVSTGLLGRVSGGFVEVDLTAIKTAEDGRKWLVGLIAGCEAGRRWSDENNARHREHHCSEDMAILHRHLRRNPLAKELTEGVLRLEARRLVADNWRKITRYAEQLAERGKISL